jgi:glycosyltransferase involved in cell wall biosynthesis
MNILFAYMARWKAINWQRFQQLLVVMAQKGHHVHVLQSPPLKGSLENAYQDIEVSLPSTMFLHDVPVPQWLWNLKLPMGKLFRKGVVTVAHASAVPEFVARYRIDVVILYNIPQYLIALNVPCLKVFDLVDDLPAMLANEVPSILRCIAVSTGNFFHRLVLRSCDLVTVTTPVLGEQFGEIQADVIPNAVSMRDLEHACGDGYRQRYGSPIIGYFGAIEYFMDFDIVLGAAQRLGYATFLLVGGGRQLESVRSRASEMGLGNVVFTGPVPYWEGLNHVAAMDVCLIPFRKCSVADSALPLKLFQYAGLKRPIVSTSVREVRRAAESFVTFADGVEDMVSTIESILNHPEAYRARILEGYRQVTEIYNWDMVAESFIRLLEDRLSSIRTRT